MSSDVATGNIHSVSNSTIAGRFKDSNGRQYNFSGTFSPSIPDFTASAAKASPTSSLVGTSAFDSTVGRSEINLTFTDGNGGVTIVGELDTPSDKQYTITGSGQWAASKEVTDA